MGKIVTVLKDRRTQYLIIIYVLLVKTIEICISLSSNAEYLGFAATLGFEHLSPEHRLAWDAIVVLTTFWLICRLLKDQFSVSISLRPLSRKRLAFLTMLLTWVLATLVTALQVTMIATAPPADPRLEIYRYVTPSNAIRGGLHASVTFNDSKVKEVTVDLSTSIFEKPFSASASGEISQYGTNVGSSYFTVQNSSLGQKIMKLKFHGNGSDHIKGWFANQVTFENPLSTDENTTFILLLKLDQSTDGTGWTYVRMDFLSKENKTDSITWKFHDVPMNYEYSSQNGTMKTYLLGSVTEWSLFQFDLNAIFYDSFSDSPSYITSIEYGVGAEANNDIAAQFLIARITPQPLEINDELVENTKPIIILAEDHDVRLSGLPIDQLSIIIMPEADEKSVTTQVSMMKASKTESHCWNINNSPNTTRIRLYFTISSNQTRVLLNGEDLLLAPSGLQSIASELDVQEDQVSLVTINETSLYLTPLVATIPVAVLLLYLSIGKRRCHSQT
ncbi:hypothetical protein MUP01_09305 [Candidatus Bathyarchaeota archaeon]|nr:hypothetical protein [Candidatus Bathyarchaeota archaeon]